MAQHIASFQPNLLDGLNSQEHYTSNSESICESCYGSVAPFVTAAEQFLQNIIQCDYFQSHTPVFG
jgi:hypothetical protein